MKNLLLIFSFTLISLSQTLFSQSVGIGTTDPDSSALLDLTSDSLGILVPRMSATQRQAIPSPAVGLMVFDSTNNAFYYFTGSGWLELLAGHVDQITDANGDTKIQVEESPDEDQIRFDVGGNEAMLLNSTGDLVVSGMRLKLSGTSRKLYEDAYPDNYLEFLSNNTTRLNANDFLELQANEHTRMLITRYDSIAMFDKTKFHDEVQLYALSTDTSAQKVLLADSTGTIRYTDLGQLKSELTDADGDTRIQVEESADDDIIRFDQGGTEYFNMTNGRLNVLNTGSSVFIGEGAGQNDDLNDNNNVFIGDETGFYNTIGSKNVAVGFHTMSANTTGYHNNAVGFTTLQSNTGGYYNAAFGSATLRDNTTGYGNSGFGMQSLVANTTGYQNSALGYQSGYYNLTGSNNVLIGFRAGKGSSGQSTSNNTILGAIAGENVAGNGNVFLGFTAGQNESGSNRLYIDNSNTSSPLIYGEFDNDWLKVNGRLTPSMGITDADGDTKIQVEESPNENNIRFDIGGTEYFVMDTGRIEFHNTGNSVFIGENAGAHDDFSDNRNTGIGSSALKANTTGRWNSGLGDSALSQNTTGSNNAANGFAALSHNHDGNDNTAIGLYALTQLTGGSQNVAVGSGAGQNSQGSGNVFLGYNAGKDEGASDRLYIDNSDTTGPLIYGEFDNDLLRVNGTLNVNGEYALPTTDGTEGQVLSTDGAGQTAWTTLLPVGTIMMWPTDTPPDGWMLCDGGTFDAGVYAELAGVLGSNTRPDLAGRFPLGKGDNGMNDHGIGETGGLEMVTLEVSQIPAHNHGAGSLHTTWEYLSGNSGAGNANLKDGSDTQLYNNTAITGSTANTGGGQPHENMPPFYVINFIIKAD